MLTLVVSASRMNPHSPLHVNAHVVTHSHTFPHMALKPKVARIYLNEEASELTKQAAQEIGDLSESQIVSLLVLAGLRALKETGFKLTLPLRLSVVAESEIPVPSTRRL